MRANHHCGLQCRRSAQKRDNVLCALLRQRVAQTRREAESREPLPTPPPPKPRTLSNNSTVTHENVRFRDCGTVGRVPNRIFKARKKKTQTHHHLYWRSCNVLKLCLVQWFGTSLLFFFIKKEKPCCRRKEEKAQRNSRASKARQGVAQNGTKKKGKKIVARSNFSHRET